MTEKLQVRGVSAHFVLRLLTDDQKESRVEICQELLANVSDHGKEHHNRRWDVGL